MKQRRPHIVGTTRNLPGFTGKRVAETCEIHIKKAKKRHNVVNLQEVYYGRIS